MITLRQTMIIEGPEIGAFRTTDKTHALKLMLAGGGGGGAGGQINVNGQGGDAADVFTVTVRVKPNTSYKWRRGTGGAGGNGIRGGFQGGDTFFYVDDLVLIARGGRGGRASGIFRRHPATGDKGSDGALIIDEFDEFPAQVEPPKAGGILLVETP